MLPPDSGASHSKLSQRGAEMVGECCQGAGRAKAWKGLAKCFMLGSHLQATAVELVLRKKVPTPEPGPGSSTESPISRSHTHKILTMDSIVKASLNQLDTQFKVTLGPLSVQPQENRSAVYLGMASVTQPASSSTPPCTDPRRRQVQQLSPPQCRAP